MRDMLGDLHPSRTVARRMHELESELHHARTQLRRYSKSPDTLGRWGLDQPAEAKQEEAWFVTYLDMMTLLLVVMIVMLAFSGNLNKTVAPEAVPGKALAATEVSFDTLAVSEPYPVPSPAPDVVPRIDSAEVTAVALNSQLAALHSNWSVADLAASFVGPPRPDPSIAAAALIVGRNAATAAAAREPDFASVAAPSTDTPAAAASAADATAVESDSSTTVESNDPTEATAVAHAESAGVSSFSDAALAPPSPAQETSPDVPSEGESLAAGLALDGLGDDVEIVVNERSVSFRVNSEILFDSSQADLSREGLSVLRRIITVLSGTDHEITVEGHTDSVPVRRNVRFPSNWELSSARAGSVVRYLQANGIDKTRLKAVGYADGRPIGDNHTPEGRGRNRRVELVIEKR